MMTLDSITKNEHETISSLLLLRQSPQEQHVEEEEEEEEEEENDKEKRVYNAALALTQLSLEACRKHESQETTTRRAKSKRTRKNTYRVEEENTESLQQSQTCLHEEEEVDIVDQAVKNRKKKKKKKRKAEKSLHEEVNTDSDGQGINKERKKRENVEEDDTQETLNLIVEWNNTTPVLPKPVQDLDLVGDYSEPIRKQLKKSDVLESQSRLMLGKCQVKKMMSQVMGETWKIESDEGLEVSVYGPKEKVYKMVFKMWNDTPVLMKKGWNEFVKDNNLMELRDFVTLWMFKHKETSDVCFAIDCVSFDSIDKKLSKRIVKVVGF